MNDVPKFLVEWPSRWQEFRTAIRPALARSQKELAGEAHTGLWPYRGLLAAWLVEAVLLTAVIVIPSHLASMRPYIPPPMPKYDVIYYSGDELPKTEDSGGAQAGRSGRAGGQEAHHNTQAIRVARGNAVRETVVDAPNVNLPQSNAAVANLLAYKPIPGPPPAEGFRASRQLPSFGQSVVPPVPQVRRDKMQPARGLETAVVAPPPAAPQNNLGALHIPGNRTVQVVPPPVSAPEQLTNLNPKLTLPTALVVAPPPQVSRDVASLGPGFGSGQIQKQVVPPPAQLSGTGTQRRAVSGIGDAGVVAPPAQVSGVVGSRSSLLGDLGNSGVVAPPTEVSGIGSGRHQPSGVLGGGEIALAPPPSIPGAAAGSGHGNRGAGLGGPFETGLVSAPPNGGGTPGGSGVVVSSQPGSKLGLPGNGGAGSLAMSPSGTGKAGVGGSGGGAGIGKGNGPGSGFSGEGSGTAKEGSGRGSDTLARGGISPYPGPGGAGSGTLGKPALPGVAVRGGSNIITLPSFGSGANDPTAPGHSSLGTDRHGPGITIVATPRSGGAMNIYGQLKGDRVYTIYFDTSLGTAVLQYADPASATHPYTEDLTAPEPMRADLPAGLRASRLVIACILDRSGAVKNAQVLEPGARELTAKVMAALPNWKFRPALHGDEPVEVNAILGFAIDTR